MIFISTTTTTLLSLFALSTNAFVPTSPIQRSSLLSHSLAPVLPSATAVSALKPFASLSLRSSTSLAAAGEDAEGEEALPLVVPEIVLDEGEGVIRGE